MADTTLVVKDGTATSKSLSATPDSSNGNALATKHVILDSAGVNSLAVDAQNQVGVKVYDTAGSNKLGVTSGGAAKVQLMDGTSGTNKLAVDAQSQVGVKLYDSAGTNKLAIDASGLLGINNVPASAALADNSANPTTAGVAALGERFNGTTWDRERGNVDLSSFSGINGAAATTTQTGADQINYNGRGIVVALDTTIIGTGSITLSIQGKDPASGKYYTLLAGAAVVSNTTNIYTVYPGGPVTTNVAANSPLPRVWRILVTANNANAASYTVGASVLM